MNKIIVASPVAHSITRTWFRCDERGVILRENIAHCVYTGNLLLMNRLKYTRYLFITYM